MPDQIIQPIAPLTPTRRVRGAVSLASRIVRRGMAGLVPLVLLASPGLAAEAVLTALSLATTPRGLRRATEFSLAATLEVACLFLGIFLTDGTRRKPRHFSGSGEAGFSDRTSVR